MMRYWLLLLSCVWLPCAAIELPDMGTSSSTVLSQADEKKLGEAFFRQLRQQAAVIDDIEINSYLNALGHRLASYSDNAEQAFRFFVVKDNTINAFAVPGGFVGVHSGLILQTQDEGELASVLAHEISHVTQHHIARTIEATSHFSLPMMAAMIAAIVVGARSPQVGQAAIASVMAGNIQMQINFTRSHEEEADRVGMQLLAGAGFDPRSMPSFFERLQASGRYYEGGVPEFLRTHPVTTDRIAESRSRADQFPKTVVDENPLFHLMKAKLFVLSEDNPQKIVKTLQQMLKEGRYRDERATRYALALALLASPQTEGVQAQIDWLFKNDTDRVAYRLLKARLALLQNNPTAALQIYEQALQTYPTDPLLSMNYAEHLLQTNAAARAKAVLLTLPSDSNPAYYRLLAQAHQATGALGESHLALAEHYYLNGQTGLAVEQLKQARQLKNVDFFLASRIEARYKELQQELAEEKGTDKKHEKNKHHYRTQTLSQTHPIK